MSHKVKDTSGTGYCVAAQPLLWDSRPYFRAVTKAASALLCKMVQKKNRARLSCVAQPQRLSLSKEI